MGEKVNIRDDLFIEGPEGTTLRATRCNECGKVFFPVVKFCPKCSESELKDIPLNKRGKLYTYTTTFMPSMHFDPPFANGYVDTGEGALIYSLLDIQEDKPFKIGMEMELKIETLWTEDDKEFVGFKFYPV